MTAPSLLDVTVRTVRPNSAVNPGKLAPWQLVGLAGLYVTFYYIFCVRKPISNLDASKLLQGEFLPSSALQAHSSGRKQYRSTPTKFHAYPAAKAPKTAASRLGDLSPIAISSHGWRLGGR
jgi:hypothetical protein